MTEPRDTPPDDLAEDEEAIRRKLVNRIAIAGVLIVSLLGGLAIIDALYVPPPTPPAPKFAEIPAEPITPKPEEAQAEKPAEEQAAENKPAEPETADKKTDVAQAEPEKTEAPSTGPAKAPKEGGTKQLKPLTVPAQPRMATMRPISPAPNGAPPRAEPAKELAREIPRVTTQPVRPFHAPASKPLTQVGEVPRAFQLQLGVFVNLANAEELRAKLELAGIPAHIEARVQVGPFSSREEAEAAQTKLSAMGINPGILMAIKR